MIVDLGALRVQLDRPRGVGDAAVRRRARRASGRVRRARTSACDRCSVELDRPRCRSREDRRCGAGRSARPAIVEDRRRRRRRSRCRRRPASTASTPLPPSIQAASLVGTRSTRDAHCVPVARKVARSDSIVAQVVGLDRDLSCQSRAPSPGRVRSTSTVNSYAMSDRDSPMTRTLRFTPATRSSCWFGRERERAGLRHRGLRAVAAHAAPRVVPESANEKPSLAGFGGRRGELIGDRPHDDEGDGDE